MNRERYAVLLDDEGVSWQVYDTKTGELVDCYKTRAEARYIAAQMNEAQRNREVHRE